MRCLWIIAAAALAACAEAEQVTDVPEGEVEADIVSPADPDALNAAGTNQVAASPIEGEPAPGLWFSRTGVEGPWAGYGPPNSEAIFSARCEGERLVFSTTEIPRSGPGDTDITFSAAGVNETLAAKASEEGLPNTEASVDANSEWLARLASATGNLTVRVGGGDPLIVPIGDPLTSLIRDCGR